MPWAKSALEEKSFEVHAYLRFIGVSQMFGITVQGSRVTTYLKAVGRNN